MTEVEFNSSPDSVKARITRIEWVWQFATSKEAAVLNHIAAFDRWEALIDAGFEPRTVGD